VTCDEVRELLPEHVLGTLEGPEDLEVRRHLRGCAGCRREMAALGDGVASFARAAHEGTPPPELQGRVMTVLQQEWRDTSAAQPSTRGGRWVGWVAGAAAALVVVAALAWGGSQAHRADVASGAASSYSRLLNTLGGKEFRIGQLRPATQQPVGGSVVLYDSHEGQSWGVVLVRAPGMTGTATVTLEAPDGGAIAVHPLEFQTDGDAATWIVTSADLTSFNRVTVTAADGTVLATAHVAVA
jgi:hypothetical protein